MEPEPVENPIVNVASAVLSPLLPLIVYAPLDKLSELILYTSLPSGPKLILSDNLSLSAESIRINDTCALGTP